MAREGPNEAILVIHELSKQSIATVTQVGGEMDELPPDVGTRVAGKGEARFAGALRVVGEQSREGTDAHRRPGGEHQKAKV